MKLNIPFYDVLLSFREHCVQTLVIESRGAFRQTVEDLYSESKGNTGECVLSLKDSPVSFSKYGELLLSFADFEIARKSLITKITAAMEKTAMDADHYLETRRLLQSIENAVDDWAFQVPGNIEAANISVGALLKAVGITLQEDYIGPTGYLEKLLDYMELVREYDRDKLFVLINLRSFYEDEDLTAFIRSAKNHEYRLLLIDNRDYPRLPEEHRLTIDEDLCVF